MEIENKGMKKKAMELIRKAEKKDLVSLLSSLMKEDDALAGRICSVLVKDELTEEEECAARKAFIDMKAGFDSGETEGQEFMASLGITLADTVGSWMRRGFPDEAWSLVGMAAEISFSTENLSEEALEEREVFSDSCLALMEKAYKRGDRMEIAREAFSEFMKVLPQNEGYARLLMSFIESIPETDKEVLSWIADKAERFADLFRQTDWFFNIVRVYADAVLRLDDPEVSERCFGKFGTVEDVLDQSIWRLSKMRRWKDAVLLIDRLEEATKGEMGAVTWSYDKARFAELSGDGELLKRVLTERCIRRALPDRKELEKLHSVLSFAENESMKERLIENASSDKRLLVGEVWCDPALIIDTLSLMADDPEAVFLVIPVFMKQADMFPFEEERPLVEIASKLMESAVGRMKSRSEYRKFADLLMYAERFGEEGRALSGRMGERAREVHSKRKAFIAIMDEAGH